MSPEPPAPLPSRHPLWKRATDRVAGLVAGVVPRGVAERLETLERDLAIVRAGLAGRRPPPFTERKPRPAVRVVEPSPLVPSSSAPPAPSAAVLAPRSLRVERVERETRDAVTLHLADPTGAPVRFVAGQFFTVLVPSRGEVLRRAYSASSSALDERAVAITIKRVAGGRASNHLNDHARAGDVLEVLGPSGAFTVHPDPARAARYVLVAGGSGVTPVMSIARTVLAAEPASRVALVYGNRALADVIFREALDALAAAHPGRFVVRHVLSDPPAGWAGGAGLLDRAALARELDALDPSRLEDATYFVCGPDAMMSEAREGLRARGVDPARVREERFTAPHLRARAPSAAADAPHLVTIRVGRDERAVQVRPGQTVLEAGLAAGAPMPFSCAMGGCGECRVRLVAGAVEMEEPNCLLPAEREANYVLACVARPTTAATVEVA